MKEFTEDFRTKLYDTTKDIEDNSLVEIVTIIKPQSSDYKHTALFTSIIATLIVYTIFIFIPVDIDSYLIYLVTLLSFPVFYLFLRAFPKLNIKFSKSVERKKNVEIKARAIFQKGGIRFTNERIGTLIYVSLLEKEVFILPDRGAKNAVPDEEWNKINASFQSIFTSENIANSLLDKLAKCKAVFSEYIPTIEHDINELPDNLDVDL